MSRTQLIRASLPSAPSIAVAIALLAMLAACALVAGQARAADSGGIGGTGGTTGTGAGTGTTVSSTKYDRLWKQAPMSERRWAHRTSDCESGGDPHAIGGGGAYRGAFQFTKQTWRRSPKSPGGDPIRYAYRVQAVVAIKLKAREGTKPWPVCG